MSTFVRVALAAIVIIALAYIANAGETVNLGGSGGGSAGAAGTVSQFSEDRAPVTGSDECDDDDLWINTTNNTLYFCEAGLTDTWSVLAPFAVQSEVWNADRMRADGTDCVAPANVTIAGGGPVLSTIVCSMTSSETDGFVYGNTILPDDVNIAADATLELTTRVVTDNAGATAHGVAEIQCVAADATVGGTWNSAANLDITQAAGDAADDLLQDTSASIDLAQGASADCAGGNVLFFRFKLCDTDATPSTGCTSSAGAENDHSIVGMKLEYTTSLQD